MPNYFTESIYFGLWVLLTPFIKFSKWYIIPHVTLCFILFCFLQHCSVCLHSFSTLIFKAIYNLLKERFVDLLQTSQQWMYYNRGNEEGESESRVSVTGRGIFSQVGRRIKEVNHGKAALQTKIGIWILEDIPSQAER